LLVVGAALAATPALAAGAVSGHRGSPEEVTNREAPVVLPGKITPMPTPKVDPSTLSRDAFADPEAGLASLGTVTLSNDGSVTETPPSDALRGIFEAFVKGRK